MTGVLSNFCLNRRALPALIKVVRHKNHSESLTSGPLSGSFNFIDVSSGEGVVTTDLVVKNGLLRGTVLLRDAMLWLSTYS